MLAYLNQVFDVISAYVTFLFGLYVMPGVSIGSIFLVGTLLWIITTTLWMRGR